MTARKKRRAREWWICLASGEPTVFDVPCKHAQTGKSVRVREVLPRRRKR